MAVERTTPRARGLEVLELEAQAIQTLKDRLDDSFEDVVNLVVGCPGRVIVTGMGKAGLIGQKLSATLASTGTPSLSLHPAEALHGDLGRVRPEDLVLALSKSGSTREVLQLIPSLRAIGAHIVAITEDKNSALGQHADHCLELGVLSEACPLGLAPTISTTAMLAMGDALAMAVLEGRDFTREEFGAFHPAGRLGQSLMKIQDIMRTQAQIPLITNQASLREALGVMTETPGRPGAAIVTDAEGLLEGIFTDGDLRRLAQGAELPLDSPITELMAKEPGFVREHQLVADALLLVKNRSLDQLPVVAEDSLKVVGLIDVQDLLEVRL